MSKNLKKLPNLKNQDLLNFDWSDIPLGTMPDRTLAKQLNIHGSTVAHYRNLLGIAPFGKSRHPIIWETQPLGQMLDTELADIIGCTRITVSIARKRLGVPAFDSSRSPKGVDWDSIPLGTKSDAEVAREFGVATSVVCNARQRRNLPRFGMPSRDIDWAQMPLGQISDDRIALLIGTTRSTVGRHRKQLNILPPSTKYITTEGEPANQAEASIDLFWHENGIEHKFQIHVGPYRADWVINNGTLVEYAGFAESRKWGGEYKERLAKKVEHYHNLGRETLVIWEKDLKNYRPVGYPTFMGSLVTHGGICWDEQPLGKISDTELAKILGIHQGEVSRIRRRLKIPKFVHPTPDWDSVGLGTKMDKEIAAQLGVTIKVVLHARKKRGIPSWSTHATV